MRSSLTEFETISLTAAREVDRACDRFEEALQTGQLPRIEDFVGDLAGPEQLALIEELIRLDTYYRHEDYRKRFPQVRTIAGLVDTRQSTGLDRYEFIRPHAEGGIGRVSLHRDLQLRRLVALKELHPDKLADPNVLSQFFQEAQITGQLEHPGIVPVYELVRPVTGDPPFYTMRFVKGRTLSEAVRDYHQKKKTNEATPLEMLTLLNAFVSVCQTVSYAHSRGVLHRDLKGSNVVLGDFGEVIVLDWGLAKLIGEPREGIDSQAVTFESTDSHSRTLQGHIKGTPQYMAPEQAAGRLDLIDSRTDVYGLGAILFEILAGRPPIVGSHLIELLSKVEEGLIDRPSTLATDVPYDLETICLRALAKDPAHRHSSASELADEVQRQLAHSAERTRSEQERERFFNLSLDMLCTLGVDNHFKQSNPAWEHTLGWTPAELMAQPYLNLMHPDDRAMTIVQVDQVIVGAGRSVFENRCLHKNGSYRWVSWIASLIPDERLIYAVGRDVTERKNAEEALRRSKERFELAVLGSGDGLWDWDLETGESYYSPRWKSMIGYEDHELSHDINEWKKRIHADDRARVIASLQAYIDGRAPAFEVEYRFQHKDGSYRWILDRGVALRKEGRMYRMAGSHADITERKQLEHSLRESEERLRSVHPQS